MRNKKVILSSILSLVLCLSLIAGGTFALFTSESKTNIAITSGNVEVVAWLDDIETSTFGTVQAENTFELGGSATYDATTNKLTVDKIAPGDRVDLNVYIENKSNISVKYRVKVAFAGELQDALVANITLPGDETATVLTAADVATGWNSFDENNKVVLPMSVELPYGVGNDYMNKSAEIIVTVEAVQANATELVMIENTRYNSFAEALAAANTGDTIVIGGNVEYVMPSGSHSNIDFKGVTIQGNDENPAVITFSGNGADVKPTNFTLKNVTVVDTTEYNETSWEFGYLELANVTAENVVFENGIMLTGTNTFTNCTFTGKTDSGMNMYGAWISKGTSTFTGCTFIGTRGLKACEYYDGDDVVAVTVDGCTFDNLTQKPGIAIDVNYGDITIKNSKFINCAAGEQNNYMYESDHDTVTIVSEGNTVSAAVSGQDALNSVLTTAGVNTIEVTLADGTYSFTQVKIWNKNVTFIGTENAVFDMTAQQGVNSVQDMLNTTLTFDGVTVKWSGQDGGYQGIKNPKKVVYKNCNIEGLQYLYGDTDFIGCTLTHKEGWAAVAYNSSNVTFTDCTFNTGNHAFLLYTDWHDAGLIFNATLTNCTFNNDGSQVELWGSEQLVECGDNPGQNIKYNLVFNNCTITGTGTKALWGNKNNMPAERLTITVDDVAQDVSNHPTANQ